MKLVTACWRGGSTWVTVCYCEDGQETGVIRQLAELDTDEFGYDYRAEDLPSSKAALDDATRRYMLHVSKAGKEPT